jgi:hypothetical protein
MAAWHDDAHASSYLYFTAPAPVVCPQCGCTVIPVKACQAWLCPHCGKRIGPAP